MVREFTELQGTMGGVYARTEGLPEEIWKAIYFHYLPVGVEADAPPTRAQLGKAAITWAAVSLADKLDTIVGLFATGEKPTGSRDPYGLRRAAHGLFKILVDLPDSVGRPLRPAVWPLVREAGERLGNPTGGWADAQLENLRLFLTERLAFVLESRGYDIRNVRAVTSGRSLLDIRPADELQKLKVLPEFSTTTEFLELAVAFKRAKNITREMNKSLQHTPVSNDYLNGLTEPAEKALLAEIETRSPIIDRAVEQGHGFREAFAEASRFKPAVDRFFDEVLVMTPDLELRQRRLALVWRLVTLILTLGDISEIVAEG